MRRPLAPRGVPTAVAWAALAAVGWTGACGPPAPDVSEAPEVAVVLPPPPFAPPPRRASEALPPLPPDLAMAGSFAHEPHGRVECGVCHQPVAGHGSHAGVACTDCHPTPPGAPTAQAVGSVECLECHHTRQTARDCTACHSAVAGTPLVVVQALRTIPGGDAVDRELPFDHAWHGDLACEGCHRAEPLQPFGETCAACHDDHHQNVSPCRACHTPSPLGDHDRTVHGGCSGAGCHSPSADAIPPSRGRCVVCHTTQEEHEIGGDCSECHLLDAAGGVAASRSSGSGAFQAWRLPW